MGASPEKMVANRPDQVHSTTRAKCYVERVIGTIRRECPDHLIVLNELSLYRHLQAFVPYYHQNRVTLGLGERCSRFDVTAWPRPAFVCALLSQLPQPDYRSSSSFTLLTGIRPLSGKPSRPTPLIG
jgi:hypothetical protein